MRLFNNLFSVVLRDKEMIGLDLTWQAEGAPILRGIKLSFTKGVILVKEKWEILDSMQLPKVTGKNLPIALVLNGKGLLHKEAQLSKVEVEKMHQVLTSIMPTINTAEFYVQHYQMEEFGFFSLARQEKIIQVFEQFANQGYTITSLSFGPFAFKSVWPYVSEKDQTEYVVVGNHKLEILNGDIKAFQSLKLCESQLENATIKIGDDEIEQKYLLAYAAAFRALTNYTDSLTLPVDLVDINRVEYQEKKKFKAGFLASIGFFFLLLLGNFFLFNNLSEKNGLLRSGLNAKQNSLKELTHLGQDANAKQKFLEATGWLEPPRTSYYADRLVSALPMGIRLTELALNPLDQKRSKTEGRIIFESGFIAIQGVCGNPIELNNWLKSLGKFKWIEQVERQNYTYDETKSEAKFALYVRLKGK